MSKTGFPMNLQFFAADPADPANPDGGQQGQDGGNNNAAQPPAAEIDYEKLASIVSGKQQVAEDTVLKNYFKQQGLSSDEAAQAIRTFKDQKAQSQPDFQKMQGDMEVLQNTAKTAMIEKEATLEAVELGLDAKTIPYVLKMADMNEVVGEDGKINKEAMKNAINKVLEDVPQLKPASESQRGFQVGGGGGEQNPGTDKDALKAAFGL